jgi:hypothetical protein
MAGSYVILFKPPDAEEGQGDRSRGAEGRRQADEAEG